MQRAFAPRFSVSEIRTFSCDERTDLMRPSAQSYDCTRGKCRVVPLYVIYGDLNNQPTSRIEYTLEIVESSELVTAFIAYEWLLLTMGQQVTFQIMKSSEILPTLLAFMLSFFPIPRRARVSRQRR
jgi:hypothetical protein